jgi:hypothetical protein
MQDFIVSKDGSVAVFSFVDGIKCPRLETLIEQARKSEDELQRVCLWLENHGQHDLADTLLERLVDTAGRPAQATRGNSTSH